MNEIIIDNKNSKPNINISDEIIKNKNLIYPLLFYISGLLLGSVLYTAISKTAVFNLMESIFKLQNEGFLELFINKFSTYFSVFTITILFGMCLVGFPFINFIPLLCGIEIALRISYFYVNYSAKGIGYSLLMIIPESAVFLLVLIHTIDKSNSLSKSIFSITMKKNENIDFQPAVYLKSFGLYAVLIIIISAVNALVTYLLENLISI